MGTQGVGTFLINSKFASGSLVFYEKTVGRTATGDVFTVGTTAVKVGGTAQDVDFQVYGTGSLSAIIDIGAATMTLVGLATATDGAVTITDATSTSSSTTGALIVTGGIATAADIWVGDDINVFDDILLSATSVINFGAGDITFTGGTGIVTIAGGLLTSTNTTGFSSTATFVPDSTRTNYALAIGTRATELDITTANAASQHFEPIQINLNIIGTIPTSTSTMNGIYMQLTHDTTAMTGYLRLKGCDWTATIAKNLQDVYIFQGEVDFTAATTVGGEAAGFGITMSTAGTSAVTGNVWGGVIATSFTSAVSVSAGLFLSHRVGTLTHSLYVEASSGATITDALYINTAGTVTNDLNIASLNGGCAQTYSSAGTGAYIIRCSINGVTTYIHTYNAV